MSDQERPDLVQYGWITWHGGVQPVSDGTLVSAMLRNGEFAFETEWVEASSLQWGHGEFVPDAEIVAWRVKPLHNVDHIVAPSLVDAILELKK